MRCTICHGQVTESAAERGWVDLEGLPRLFFCPAHWPGDHRFIRAEDGTWLYVRGDVVALRAPVVEAA